jgi:benzoylformate decarboxylase
MLALMDHPELTYVMAMQESLVVAMADGFSRALGEIRRLQCSRRSRSR